MLEAVERERPDRIFHLGDVNRDIEDVKAAYPEITVNAVVGNCDGWISNVPEELEVTVDGVKFFFAHGHRFFLPGGLLREGRERGAAMVLYGHTHEAVLQQQADGRWLMNPGTIGGVRRKATYGVIVVEDGKLSAEIKEL